MKAFQGPVYATPRGTLVTYETTVDERIRWIARCDDVDLLASCLRVRGLQRTVRTAIERRQRALARAAK